jgi:hypothetical protein
MCPPRRTSQKETKVGPSVVKESGDSGVKLEQAAEPVTAANGPALRRQFWRGEKEEIVLALVVPFQAMTGDVPVQGQGAEPACVR